MLTDSAGALKAKHVITRVAYSPLMFMEPLEQLQAMSYALSSQCQFYQI